MSTSTMTRPTSTRTARETALPVTTLRVGSYVDSDGVRRAPARTGSYAGTTSIVGTYTGTSAAIGSYVRTQR